MKIGVHICCNDNFKYEFQRQNYQVVYDKTRKQIVTIILYDREQSISADSRKEYEILWIEGGGLEYPANKNDFNRWVEENKGKINLQD